MDVKNQLHEPGSNPDLMFALGIPHNWDNFAFPYVHSVIGLSLYEASKPKEERLLGSILQSGGCYVDDNRTILALDLINKATDDYLVMVDTDIEFPPNILELLYDHVNKNPEARIIAGRVDLANGLPVFYKVDNEKHVNTHQPFPFDGLKKFDLVGTGIICIHRSVFLELNKKEGHQHFFARIITQDNIRMGDDFSFCMRCWKNDIPVYGAWNIYGIHQKRVPIRSAYLQQNQLEVRIK